MTVRTIDPWLYLRASTAGPREIQDLELEIYHTNQDQEQGFDTLIVITTLIKKY